MPDLFSQIISFKIKISITINLVTEQPQIIWVSLEDYEKHIYFIAFCIFLIEMASMFLCASNYLSYMDLYMNFFLLKFH